MQWFEKYAARAANEQNSCSWAGERRILSALPTLKNGIKMIEICTEDIRVVQPSCIRTSHKIVPFITEIMIVYQHQKMFNTWYYVKSKHEKNVIFEIFKVVGMVFFSFFT